jgi:hypothetical protein
MDGAGRSAGGGGATLSLAELPHRALVRIAARVWDNNDGIGERRHLGALRACCAATRAAVDELAAGHLRARRAPSLARATTFTIAHCAGGGCSGARSPLPRPRRLRRSR